VFSFHFNNFIMKSLYSFCLMLFIYNINIAQPNDCVNAIPICQDFPVVFNPIGPGTNDFINNNSSGCLSAGEHQSVWFSLTVAEESPVEAIFSFDLIPDAGLGQDYDFALFGPVTDCDSLGYPARCSYAAGFCAYCPATGLSSGTIPVVDMTEGAGGDGYVSGKIVVPGERYYLIVDNFSSNSSGFSLIFTGNALFDCDPVFLNVNAGADQLVCGGQSLQLDANSAGSGDIVEYLWSPATYLDNPNIKSPLLALPASGADTLTYTVTVYSNGESDADSLRIFIKEAINPVIMPIDSICADDAPVLLTADPPGGVWGGSASAEGIFDPSSGPGIYDIFYTISSNEACEATTILQIEVCENATTSVPGLSSVELSFSVSPNPVKNQLYIHTQTSVSLILTDMLGNKIQYQSFENAGSYIIDISYLPQGVYFLTDIISGDVVKMNKI
jgi:hypothetical protein